MSWSSDSRISGVKPRPFALSLISSSKALREAGELSNSRSQGVPGHKAALPSTFSTCATRLLIPLLFVLIIYVFPMRVATMLALAYGLGLLVLTSYSIAMDSNVSPRKAVLEHIVVAAGVILVSEWLGRLLSSRL